MNTLCDALMDAAGGIPGYEGTLADPQWSNRNFVHDWRNHVPEYLRQSWERMSTEARVVAYFMAREAADAEEWE